MKGKNDKPGEEVISGDTFQKALKKWRDAGGSGAIKALAQASGVSAQTLYNILYHGTKPRFETQKRIFEALGPEFITKPDYMNIREVSLHKQPQVTEQAQAPQTDNSNKLYISEALVKEYPQLVKYIDILGKAVEMGDRELVLYAEKKMVKLLSHQNPEKND